MYLNLNKLFQNYLKGRLQARLNGFHISSFNHALPSLQLDQGVP